MEVVMFQEGRSRAEIAHNTLIKDSMRGSTVIESILRYLCQHILTHGNVRRPEEVFLCVGCLECLAELVGWIDLTLYLSVALPALQSILQLLLTRSMGPSQDPRETELRSLNCKFQAAVFGCFLELAKKGMDPVEKVQLLCSLKLIHQLKYWCDCYLDSAAGKSDEEDEDSLLPLEKLGLLTEELVLELLGCWCKYEDMLLTICEGGPSKLAEAMSNQAGFQALRRVARPTAALLHMCVPIAVRLLGHCKGQVSGTVVGACNKIIAVLRAQQKRIGPIEALLSSNPDLFPISDIVFEVNEQPASAHYFSAVEYLNPLLMCIYQQLQYPEDFDAEAAEEFESDVVEVQCPATAGYSACTPSLPLPAVASFCDWVRRRRVRALKGPRGRSVQRSACIATWRNDRLPYCSLPDSPRGVPC